MVQGYALVDVKFFDIYLKSDDGAAFLPQISGFCQRGEAIGWKPPSVQPDIEVHTGAAGLNPTGL